MLDDLRQLRELQLAQVEALQAGDTERLSTLDAQRLELQARILPGAATTLEGADLAEAQALIRLIAQDQEEMTERAVEARETLGDELRGLSRGRAALTGYRPTATGSSVLVDKSR